MKCSHCTLKNSKVILADRLTFDAIVRGNKNAFQIAAKFLLTVLKRNRCLLPKGTKIQKYSIKPTTETQMTGKIRYDTVEIDVSSKAAWMASLI